MPEPLTVEQRDDDASRIQAACNVIRQYDLNSDTEAQWLDDLTIIAANHARMYAPEPVEALKKAIIECKCLYPQVANALAELKKWETP